jgi:hypothetical protein
MKKTIILGMLAGFLLLGACKKKEEAKPAILEVQIVSNLPADPTSNPSTGQPQPASGKFTLYSLRENTIVPNTDSTTNKWDIGFRGTTIIVNGGAIRAGQGGAFIFTGLFEDLKEIDANQTFATDQSPTQLAIPTGSGNGWYNYNPQQNWISPIPGKVLVIRTGDGKFAKVEILSYYKDAPTTPSISAQARYYTFRYVYQPNGSKKF